MSEDVHLFVGGHADGNRIQVPPRDDYFQVPVRESTAREAAWRNSAPDAQEVSINVETYMRHKWTSSDGRGRTVTRSIFAPVETPPHAVLDALIANYRSKP